jgi:hypothetical protein
MKKIIFVLGLMVSVYSKAQWNELGGYNSLQANNGIFGLCQDKYGNIYASGWFDNNTNAGGLFKYVAKWEKITNTWSELGGHNSLHGNGGFYALCCDTFGNVFCGGVNTAAWGVGNSGPGYMVAKWDKITDSWDDLANSTSIDNFIIWSLLSDKEGNIYSGAGYSLSSGNTQIYNIGKCSKATNTWVKSGSNDTSILKFIIRAMTIDKLGNVYAVGENYGPVPTSPYVAKLDKATNTWSKLGGSLTSKPSGLGNLYAVYADTFGNIYTGGYILDDSSKTYVAKYDGNNWNILGGANSIGVNSNNTIKSITGSYSGNIYVTGSLYDSSGHLFVAKWNGNSWSKLIVNLQNFSGQINCMFFDEKTQTLYSAGDFKNNAGNHYVAFYKENTLPLTLTSFTTTLQQNNVLLNWHTANEVNVSHFNIQRSSNGKEFITIGKVNAGSVSGYSFLDSKLPNTNEPTLYYRLEIVDKDGSKTYSEIKRVTLNEKQETRKVLIYPNPANSIVTIECSNAKELLIIDYLGRTIYKSMVNSQWSIVNTKQFAKGMYLVKVIMKNGDVKTEKLVIE